MNNWITHTGGKCPVKEGTLIDVKYRDGEELYGLKALSLEVGCRDSSVAFWGNDRSANDIIAYRLHKDNETTTIEKIKKATAKRDKLTAKLAKANKNLADLVKQLKEEISSEIGMECKINCNQRCVDIPEGVDINDPTTWQEGDIVECIDVTPNHSEYFTKNKEYILNGIDSVDIQVKEDDHGKMCWMSQRCFRFIRRP